MAANQRANIFQHVPFEGPGRIQPWLEANGFTVESTRFFAGERPPPPDTVDFLVILGGPMSVNDEATLPWLAEEKRFVRDLIPTGTPILGICLGAQMIASALGARVYPNGEKEIGWWPIQGERPINPADFAFSESETVFHWHGETFDLPAGARRLATSRACANQAFQFGRTVIGLQFHLETTPATAQALVNHCRAELVPARHVQTADAMLAAPPTHYQRINRIMDELLTHLFVASSHRRNA